MKTITTRFRPEAIADLNVGWRYDLILVAKGGRGGIIITSIDRVRGVLTLASAEEYDELREADADRREHFVRCGGDPAKLLKE